MALISEAEKAFIAGGIADDVRIDGRRREEWRRLEVELGVISQASGSARVLLGGTEVVACCKAELESPLEGRGEEGRVEVAVECSPTADPKFEGRGGEKLAMEVTQVMQRCFGGAAAVDAASLCVVPHRTCWVLYLDALLLHHDGNVADAVAMACKAALSDTVIPKVEVIMGDGEDGQVELEIVEDEDESRRLDLTNTPLVVTVTRVGRQHFVDPCFEEEALVSASLSVGVRQEGRVSGIMTKGGRGMHPSELTEMISASIRIGRQLHAVVDAAIEGARRDEMEA